MNVCRYYNKIKSIGNRKLLIIHSLPFLQICIFRAASNILMNSEAVFVSKRYILRLVETTYLLKFLFKKMMIIQIVQSYVENAKKILQIMENSIQGPYASKLSYLRSYLNGSIKLDLFGIILSFQRLQC